MNRNLLKCPLKMIGTTSFILSLLNSRDLTPGNLSYTKAFGSFKYYLILHKLKSYDLTSS